MVKSSKPEKEDNLVYEMHYIMASDITPISSETSLDEMASLARDNTQLLINKLFALPREKTEDGYAAILPVYAKQLRLPRIMPLPQKVPKTRWETFAQEKGIVKRKRSRLVFDEAEKDWVPRWGANSSKNLAVKRDVIKEVKAGEDPFADPWANDRAARKHVIAKQKLREIRNTLEKGGATTKQRKEKQANASK
eukprot:GDKJ01057195.1.p1 GENE.GDKJ01057195.1~~GDKJ01057195.1.p1  ORF type:complete len:194 (-),score=51.81 GDKJ01057195.1:71-652(-)